MTERIEIYTAANGQKSWRRRGRNGRLLAGPVETFKSRSAVAGNLSAVFGLCDTPEGIRTLARTLPFDPGDPAVTIRVNLTLVEIHGPSAPRRPRSHNQHRRKAIAATLK